MVTHKLFHYLELVQVQLLVQQKLHLERLFTQQVLSVESQSVLRNRHVLPGHVHVQLYHQQVLLQQVHLVQQQ